MLIKNRYYTLCKKKFLTDGNFIPERKKILYICTQDDKMQFKYVDENRDIIVFWEKDSNVEFVEEIVEVCNVKEHECLSKIIKSSK